MIMPPPLESVSYSQYPFAAQQNGNQQAASQVMTGTPASDNVSKESNFSQLSLCFAIDVSTSTRSKVLEQEKSIVAQIHKLLSPGKQIEARGIPWSGQSYQDIAIKEIQSLKTSWGTDPRTIFSSTRHLQILQNCSLWFLLTDGQVSRTVMEEFSEQTLTHGMHGTPSVIIIFGSTMEREKPTQPANADISVGISIFALATDCLLLYHDISTQSGLAYIIQAKGCFRQFLPGGKTLSLNSRTSWKDLPRIPYASLASVNVPAPRKLGRTEIALGKDMRVNLDEMYSGNLDKATTDQILGDVQSMSSIVQAEVARGRSGKLQSFLTRQSAEDAQHPNLYSETQKSSRFGAMSSASARIRSDSRMRAPTSATLSAWDEKIEEPIVQMSQYVPPTLKQTQPYSWTTDREYTSITDFRGKCMYCGRHGILALLLKRSTPEDSTPNFPEEYSSTPLSFPLAMGLFAETDIITSLLYCEDFCAARVRAEYKSMFPVLITGALILKSHNDQPEKWSEEISSALGGRFSKEDISQVFLAICDSMLQRLALSTGSSDIEYRDSINSQKLVSALFWIRSELLYSVDLFMSPLPSPASSCAQSFAESYDYYVMECPLEAFVVYIRLEKDFHFMKWSDNTISDVVFKRLMLHFSQAYARMLLENGALETGMLLMPLLFHDSEDRRMTSPFRDLKFKSSVHISDLSNTELLDQETLGIFISLGDFFTSVRLHMAPATAVFLHHLVKFGTQDGDSSYQSLSVMDSVVEVLSVPRGMSVSRSTELIGKLLKRSS